LLLAAGLMMRTFIALQNVELGFRVQNVIQANVQLPPNRYRTLSQRNQFALELTERIKRIPGVEAVSLGNGGTPFNGFSTDATIEGGVNAEKPQMEVILAGADYLKALTIPLISGREFTQREVADGGGFAIINQSALKLWPAGEDPVGKRVKLDLLQNPGRALKPDDATGWVTIVGVMGDVRSGLRSAPRPTVVVPFTLVAPVDRSILIRTAGDAPAAIHSVSEQLKQMDNEQPLGRPSTLTEIVARQTVQPRFTLALFTTFALLGLALAAFGIYSVLSYFVSQRTRELGVRMALGARGADILGLILSAGGRLLLIGLAIGAFGGFASSRLLSEQLFGVGPNDPLTYLGVAFTLSAIGLIACFIPARRASRLNPIEALRYE
jgi:putative ABC transport system permease protein